ncbi:MAG: ABC transporter permease [Fimbriimonas sp.]
MAIFSQALREYLRLRRVLPWFMLAGICLLLAYLWKQLDRTAQPIDQYASVSSMLVFRLLALASAIFTTAILSQEVEQRTIVYLLTRPVPRWRLLLTRYVASVIVVTIVGAFAAVVTSIGAYGPGFMNNPLLGRDILALAVGALAYGALFLFVSLLFNRALIICALFAFGWESSIPNLPGDLYRLSVFSYLQAIAEHPTSGGGGVLSLLSGTAGSAAITKGQAFMVLGLMVAGLLAVSAWWFTHFEFVPREDAE